MIKKVHHIGIAVNNLQESVALFEKLLGVKAHIEGAPCQKVTEAVFKIGGGVEIDLLEPMGPDSTVAKFLEKRGEGLHHIALEVDDIDNDLKAMEKKGIQLIDREGREGVAGKIGFLHPKSANGVLIELVQPRKEGE
ncbi:MAG: methylmalonyl-CoA epimerase [Chloroflexi bacterium RBG_13_51_18]|nr:MAG: methylmalonyl-CoA epimerase [Chloroflexi bacterium RBG_13_51_18]